MDLRRIVGWALGLIHKKPTSRTVDILLKEAKTPEELLRAFDDLLTETELRRKELEIQLTCMEELEQTEIEKIKEKIKEGKLTGRQKRNALLTVRHLRIRLDAYENRLRILDKNMDLYIDLTTKIKAVQDMGLSGMGNLQIDVIMNRFEAELERYTHTMDMAQVATESVGTLATGGDDDLILLEKEILSRDLPKITKEPAEKIKRPTPELFQMLDEATENRVTLDWIPQRELIEEGEV